MIEIRQTDGYAKWFGGLRDRAAQMRINVRVRRLSLGNPGDVKSVGKGVSELRIDYGPGYRVYFTKHGDTVFILLAGGEKRTQEQDIRKAHELAQNLQEVVMAKTKTKKWDVVDHLKTKEDMAAYLEAVLEDGDPALIAAALGDIARAAGGIAKVARETGLGRESLYKALSPEGNPEFSTVLQVVRALGLRLHAAPAAT